MKKYLITASLLLFGAGAIAQTSGGVAQSGHFQHLAAVERPPAVCALAVIWQDGTVTVDQACVNKLAARWSPDNTDTTVAWAYALKAVRDGSAK